MTVVNPDSIAGITSVTSSGTTLEFYDVNGNLLDVSANLTGELTVGTGATISSPGANIIDFETNGSERLRITSSGNLGVGGATGTDFSLLDGIVINTDNGDAGLLINSSSSSHNAYMSFGYGSGSGTSHADQFSAYIGRVGDNTLILGTNNNIRATVTSDGDFIIGNTTTTDGAHFQHYQSSARHQSFQSTNGDLAIVTDNNSNPALYIKGTGTADLVNVFDNTTEVFTIKDGGNVGVGIDDPQKKLNVVAGVGTTELIRLSQPVDASVQQEFGIGWCSNNNHTHPGAQITSLEYDVSDPRRALLFYTRGVNSDSAPTERLRIDSDGHLHIKGTDKQIRWYRDNNNFDRYGSIFYDGNYFNIKSPSNDPTQITNSSGTVLAKFNHDTTIDIPGGVLQLGTANTSSAHLNAYETMTFNIDTDNDDTNRYFAFYKNGANGSGSELMRLSEDGKVHLGNSGHGTNKVGGQNITGQDFDPTFKIYQSTSNHWLMHLRSDTGTGSNGIFMRAGTGSSNYTAYFTGRDENNPHLLVRGDGVVSIGAKYTQGGANPQLSMYGSSGRQFKIMNSGANTTGMQLQNSTTGYGEDAGVQFACLGGGNTYLVNQYDGADFLWYSKTGGSSKHIFTIYDDGKIANQTNTDNLMLSNSQDGSGSNYYLRGSKNSTTPGGGNDTVWIYEDGDIRNNNNSYGQQSDIKLKENIVDAGPQWDDIKNLKVRKFNFKASTGFDTHTQIGLIAQEAELVSPGLIKEVKDRVKIEEISEVDGSKSYKESLSETEKTKHVMYSVLYMKAIKCLQEAQARIETLEAKVAANEAGDTTYNAKIDKIIDYFKL